MSDRLVHVPEGLDGERLDAALARMFGFSRTGAAELIAAGDVLVDGRQPMKSDRVTAGAELTVTLPPPPGAVTEAFALAIIADGQKGAYPGEPRAAIDLEAARKDARAIDLAAAELRKIAPNAGSYVSESNYFNRSWQRDYWGENYARLRIIKRKYDPDGLFFVHHGVGSEDWSDDGFTRRV